MSDDVKRRLERLHDDLAELIDMPRKPCGFGLFTSPEGAGVKLPQPSGWKFLEGRVGLTRKDEDYIRLEPSPWLDPFPSGTACVRWWGDVDRAEAFQG
jgi:hypothetical protein